MRVNPDKKRLWHPSVTGYKITADRIKMVVALVVAFISVYFFFFKILFF